MMFRLIIGAGLFAFGYYIGKQVGLTEPIRKEFAQAREKEEAAKAGQDDVDGELG